MNRIRTMSLRKNYAYICKDLYPNQKLLMLRGRPMGLLLIWIFILLFRQMRFLNRWVSTVPLKQDGHIPLMTLQKRPTKQVAIHLILLNEITSLPSFAYQQRLVLTKGLLGFQNSSRVRRPKQAGENRIKVHLEDLTPFLDIWGMLSLMVNICELLSPMDQCGGHYRTQTVKETSRQECYWKRIRLMHGWICSR